ncbi:MAG: hypothetical protein R3F41_17995 [Gammaproteobacteria bacterium]|nr:class I SAM-dependent methyltransferase [Pseudomonadales bacterium]MCP5347441.1 class I SAM-dependent methyltransferase [Pseudomonadales bacterium]
MSTDTWSATTQSLSNRHTLVPVLSGIGRRCLQISISLLIPVLSLMVPGVGLRAQMVDEAAVIAAMQQPDRLPADIERDTRSRPEKIIPLLGIEPGDRVVDIFAGGGYYSELLARVLAPDGVAVLHNNMGFEAWGVNELTDRFYRRDPGNIDRHTTNGINLDLPAESVDAALIVMALHDLYVVPKRYNGKEYVPVGSPMNVQYFLEQVFNALRGGGRFVVVDHAGEPGMDNDLVADLHRLNENFARTEIEARGFEFVTSSNALRNPADDRNRIVFDEDLRGRTDRFVLVFQKP